MLPDNYSSATTSSKRAAQRYDASKSTSLQTQAIDPITHEIVQIIGRSPSGVRQAAISSRFTIAHRAVQRRLNKLEDSGRIFSIRLPGRRSTRYFLKNDKTEIANSKADGQNLNIKSQPIRASRRDEDLDTAGTNQQCTMH